MKNKESAAKRRWSAKDEKKKSALVFLLCDPGWRAHIYREVLTTRHDTTRHVRSFYHDFEASKKKERHEKRKVGVVQVGLTVGEVYTSLVSLVT